MSARLMTLVTVGMLAAIAGCGADAKTDDAGTVTGDHGTDTLTDPDLPPDVPPDLPPIEGGLGPAAFDEGELDPASHGGTITFAPIGAPGWYPSRRDPELGPCDALETDTCCLARHDVAGDALTPWDEDLILTLRGPLVAKQLAVYQPSGESDDAWALVSAWDSRTPSSGEGIVFRGDFGAGESEFDGAIGTECLVDVSSDQVFACGPGSSPYCPESADARHHGWSGSKLFVILATMPHADEVAVGTACSTGTDGNWYDAPWLGLSLGELVRAGAFSDCHCYAKDPAQWWLSDGCGQFNVFEVVNDNNEFRNLELFSTNFIGYAGYVGEGPCGASCDVSTLAAEVDLVDKTTLDEAVAGATASPDAGPGAAFRRPSAGYRYFVIHLDVVARTVQLGLVHPDAIPSEIAPLLPNLPSSVPQATIDALLDLRLPSQ
jgi:hypothetical protein